MRIIGEIEHPQMKITVFKMDTKFSIKFETGLYEQTFKYRQSDQIDSIESIKTLVDPIFQQSVLEHFNELHRIRMKAFKRLEQEGEETFEEII